MATVTCYVTNANGDGDVYQGSASWAVSRAGAGQGVENTVCLVGRYNPTAHYVLRGFVPILGIALSAVAMYFLPSLAQVEYKA